MLSGRAGVAFELSSVGTSPGAPPPAFLRAGEGLKGKKEKPVLLVNRLSGLQEASNRPGRPPRREVRDAPAPRAAVRTQER